MLARRIIVKNSNKVFLQSRTIQPSTLYANLSRLNTPPSSFATATRNIHFLPLLGLWGAKHLSTWTLYNACKNYGWQRVYRRLLEQNRLLNHSNPTLLSSTKDAIRMAIEVPPKFAAHLSQYSEVILPFLQKIVDRAVPTMPGFLVAAAKFIVGSQKPVKIMQDLAGAAAKSVK